MTIGFFLPLTPLQKRKKAAEIKLVAIVAAYIILAIFLLVDFEISFLHELPREEAIQRYLWCEALGNVSNECSREMMESYANPYTDSIGHLVYMLIPIVGLIFVINCKQIKEKVSLRLSRPSGTPTSKKSVSIASASTQV